MSRQRLRALVSAVAVAVALVIFVRAGAGQWDNISHASVSLIPGWLVLSFVVNFIGFVADTYAMQRAYCAVARRPELMTLKRAIALFNVSALLKYLPGRVWVLMSQIERGTRGGLEADVLIQANLTCSVTAIATGLVTGSVFLLTYGLRVGKTSVAALALVPFAAACGGVAIYRYSPVALASVMKALRRPIPPGFRLPSDGQLAYVIAIYSFSWFLAAIGGVAAWLAFGRPQSFNDFMLVGSSMGAGQTIALLAFIVPGGLGIREGAMLWMLDSSVGREAAVLLPLLTRVIYTACEGILGGLGLVFARERGPAVVELEKEPERQEPRAS